MKRQGYTKKDIAEKLGTSQANISKKFKFNDWRESDVKKICAILGIESEMMLKFDDGTVI